MTNFSHFSNKALWEYQSKHEGQLPDDASCTPELEEIARSLFLLAQVHKKVLTAMPKELLQYGVFLWFLLTDHMWLIMSFFVNRNVAQTAAHEFNPICAVIGGMLAQDMLKALASRDPPIANMFFFDGNTGHGSVCRMNM